MESMHFTVGLEDLFNREKKAIQLKDTYSTDASEKQKSI